MIGGQAQEAAVALVGLDHHPVARAQAGVGAIGVDDAAIDDGRIDAAGIEQRGDHARWWWSCHACRRPRRTISGASARPASRRGAPPGCSVARAATTSGLSRFTAVEMTTTCASPRFASLVADRHRDAGLRAGAARWRCRRCRCPAPGSRELCSTSAMPRHADAADADEVDGADVEWQRAHQAVPIAVSARAGREPASARSRAACGRACAAVAAAALARRSGTENRPREALGQRLGGEARLRIDPAPRRPAPARAHWRSGGRRSPRAGAPASRGVRRSPTRRWSRRRRAR